MILFHSMIDFNLQNKRLIKTWLKDICQKEKKIIKDLNYIFCSDKYILKKNIKYLNHNYYTDVLTFDCSSENEISGDIIISIERVKENAEKYNVQFKNELFRVMSHGLLHLLSYNDNTKNEAKIMKKMEENCLKMLYNPGYKQLI